MKKIYVVSVKPSKAEDTISVCVFFGITIHAILQEQFENDKFYLTADFDLSVADLPIWFSIIKTINV